MAAVHDAHRRGDLLALRTSGTSGRPRAVVRTTASWFGSFGHVTRLLGMDATSRVWVPGPLASTMNLFAAVHATDLGAELTRTSEGATHAVVTPATLARLIAQGFDAAGRHLLVAGDRLTVALHDRALDAGASRVSHYYGAAELSFVAWGSHAEDLRAFPEVELDSREGVVWARSPYLCRGYVGSDGGPLRRGPDGFATVGDLGELDGGLVRLRGRADDTVVTAGATVLTGEVEDALEQATGRRPLVVGVPHPDLGEVLCAVVSDPDDATRLRSAARHVLPAAARPRRWFWLEQLPLTPAGKPDRARAASMLTSSEGGRRLV